MQRMTRIASDAAEASRSAIPPACEKALYPTPVRSEWLSVTSFSLSGCSLYREAVIRNRLERIQQITTRIAPRHHRASAFHQANEYLILLAPRTAVRCRVDEMRAG